MKSVEDSGEEDSDTTYDSGEDIEGSDPIIYMMILRLEMIALTVMRKMKKRWEK